jgi:adenylate kinase family enzyme
MKSYSRIAIIGNSCAGKTRLASQLARRYHLPLIHVDQIQFMEGLKFRPYPESIQILEVEQNRPQWIIDGFGPLDILEKRLQQADWIIMIDLPLRTHYYWAIKRVIKNIFIGQRKELPPNSSERKLEHIIKLFKTIYQIHTKMRPEMLRILSRDTLKTKTTMIHSVREWNQTFKQ